MEEAMQTGTVSAHDVAAAVLARTGPISAMKLEKLVYYCQAWHVVWEDRPLFAEPIEAWANGPVVRALYEFHRGLFTVGNWPRGDARWLSADQITTVEAVVDYYGDKSAQYLSDLTHNEEPWRLARRGMTPGHRGESKIRLADMSEYYSSLT